MTSKYLPLRTRTFLAYSFKRKNHTFELRKEKDKKICVWKTGDQKRMIRSTEICIILRFIVSCLLLNCEQRWIYLSLRSFCEEMLLFLNSHKLYEAWLLSDSPLLSDHIVYHLSHLINNYRLMICIASISLFIFESPLVPIKIWIKRSHQDRRFKET